LGIKNQSSNRMVIESDLNNIQKVEKITEKIAKYMRFSEEEQDSFAISVTEIVGNAIVHGNKQDKNKKVTVDFEYKNDMIVVSIQDEGKGFSEGDIANPLEPENLLKESGRGIFIVRALMDQVDFIRTKSGTRVRLVKKTKSQQTH
jgi:serine/threonine-protein kinase RsbW